MNVRKGIIAFLIFLVMFIAAWRADAVNNRYVQHPEREDIGILEVAPQQLVPLERFNSREYIRHR
ncbi:hypothetical protein [Alkalihalobacterium bogoriense]|uniref:hypothetical protein n=1 Tax=Alkalihalobacterium bogoriense TaxID=246272 RepID=UPI00047DAC63|nr:hypothetical protein [Alkalihalobacterium bogoriense]